MTKKAMLWGLLVFTLAATAWAQAPTDGLLGPHNVVQKGCKSCHAPHNGSVANGGSDASTGEIYLWGRTLKTGVFTTFGGGSLTLTGSPAENDPVVHTQLCMSCHDGIISDITMRSETLVGYGNDLSNDHPVHVQYVSDAQRPYNWAITIAGGRVSFNDSNFVAGHPARLYLDAAGTSAYVECTTCHNPHSYRRAVLKIAGVNQVKPSDKFIRGWYSPTDGSTQANFCRSCHYSKSDQYDGSPK